MVVFFCMQQHISFKSKKIVIGACSWDNKGRLLTTNNEIVFFKVWVK
jgi:hypothetical protein